MQRAQVLVERYDIVRYLGAGGAGTLVLVRDRRRDGALAALKILRPRIPDPGLEPLFRNEFLLLSGVDHESIVSVHDFGVLESGEPFFTMEYVPGQDCRSFVKEDQLEAGEYLDLVSRMLSALAHLHARGIVHRDLKPENVIMRRGDRELRPVLVDFGLAMSATAGRAGEASGTLPYIAPEVLAGAAADGRSDLFAFGMLLYELCTGKPVAPPKDLLRQPARTLAADRVRRNMRKNARGAVPRRMEDLVCRLLAPSPTGRYPSASAALEALADLYGEEVVGERVEVAGPPTFGEPPLVGRDRALESLLQRVDALKDSRLLDPIVVVAGPAGFGVSRLLATLGNHAQAADCVVSSGADLPELVYDIARHPAVNGDVPEPGESGPALVFRADSMLHALPADQHCVMILDNVHRLEDAQPLRDWVTALERREGRARVLLVLGGRTDGESAGAELLRTAGRAVPVELRDLSPLSTNDVRTALSILLDRPRVPAAVVQTLEKASGGSPRVFGELVRLLIAESVLVFEDGESVLREEELDRIELPQGVLEVARRRNAQLPKAARAPLARIALVEDPLSFEAAREVVGEQLATLLAARVLVRDRGRVRFPSELARLGADQLSGATRRKALRETAKRLAKEAPQAAALLYVAADDFARAREIGLPSARALIGERRSEEAQALLRRLAGEQPDEPTAALLVSALYQSGRAAEAADVGLRHVGLDSAVDFVMNVAAALRESHRAEEALELLRAHDRETEGETATRVANAKAGTLLSLDRLEEALLESGRAEAAAGSLLGLGGNIARARANIFRAQRRMAAVLPLENLLIDAPEEVVRPQARLAAILNRALLRDRGGAVMEALADLRRALRLARESNRLVAEARALYNIGSVLFNLGRPTSATERHEKARALFERVARQREAARALIGAAASLAAEGRAAEAESRLARAENLPGADVGPAGRSLTSLVRARLDQFAGRETEALDAFRATTKSAVAEDDPDLAVQAAVAAAEVTALGGDAVPTEAAWRRALTLAWRARRRDFLADVRVGLATCAAWRGAWRLAETMLDHVGTEAVRFKTPLRARALVLRAFAAVQRSEAAAAGRHIEEAVAVANRARHLPLRAEVYSAAAALLQETEVQRWLRKPTAAASAALLEAAREIWAAYGNETMLRKIDLHLSELPRQAHDPHGGPDADRLVKVLHIAREMNREFDRDRLLGLILDRAIELTGAERGFVILLKEGREDVHLARNIDKDLVPEPERKVSTQIISEVVRTGRIVRSEDAELDQRFEEYLSVRQLHLKSIIAVPFRSGGRTLGALYLDNRFRPGSFTEREERLLELFADQAVSAIDKAELIRELEGKSKELEEHYRRQKAELRRRGRDLTHAQREIRAHRRARGWGFDRIVARSVAMQGLVREAKRVAASELPVLLTGESGTGKEVMARAMHFGSSRQAMPFQAVNCAAVAEGLLEAELFGHVRGSFTGADRDRAGFFEQADGGTLFLDEIGDMGLPMQVRLLRALELGEVKRVGETQVRTVDVRVIAATNKDLEEMIRNGAFREDLYYRLAGFVLRMPPLRERLEDLEPLAYAFVEDAARRAGRHDLRISNEAIAKLEGYSWPGNIRELRNVILRASVKAEGEEIQPDDVAFEARVTAALTGFDPAQADRILGDLANAGVELNRRQQTALTRVLTRGKLAFREYRQIFRVSKSTTARDLEGLVREELLEKRGKTRAVIYLAGPRLRELAAQHGAR